MRSTSEAILVWLGNEWQKQAIELGPQARLNFTMPIYPMYSDGGACRRVET